jgi:lipopolysaccharide biosynthesis glycosyltransferase
VYAADEGNAVGAVVSAASFHRSNPTVQIVVLTDGWSLISLERLRAVVPQDRLKVIDLTGRSRSLPAGHAHISSAAFLRLLIPDLIVEDVIALYLDADTLVRHDLTQDLVRFAESGDTSTGGVRDFGIPRLASAGGVSGWRSGGLDPQAPHINSGVMMMRLARWRAEGIGARALTWALENGSMGDQPGIKAVLDGDVVLLRPALNATTHMLRDPATAYADHPASGIDEAVSDPAIVHFTGFVKPWHTDCTSPFVEEWRIVAADCGQIRMRSAFTARTRVLQRIRGSADRLAWAQPSRQASFVPDRRTSGRRR